MSRPKESSSLDATIRVDHLPPEGRELSLVADPEQRSALAERLLVSSVEALEVELKVVKFRGGLRVFGRLHAVVVQPCVVSMVPVTQDIEEPIDRIFLPAAVRPARGRGPRRPARFPRGGSPGRTCPCERAGAGPGVPTRCPGTQVTLTVPVMSGCTRQKYS